MKILNEQKNLTKSANRIKLDICLMWFVYDVVKQRERRHVSFCNSGNELPAGECWVKCTIDYTVEYYAWLKFVRDMSSVILLLYQNIVWEIIVANLKLKTLLFIFKINTNY